MDIIQMDFVALLLVIMGEFAPLPPLWGILPHDPLFSWILTQCGMDIIQMNFCCFVFSNYVALFLVIEITNYIAYPEMSDISSYGDFPP